VITIALSQVVVLSYSAVHHCRLDDDCRLPMLLLHFMLFLADYSIYCRQKVPLEGCQPIAAL
jgi:hypothetical protein